MDKEMIFEHLDLSGGKDSWFDMWHTHADWDGSGNKDWKLRKQFIDELVDFYHDLKLKMKDFPLDFQLFIWILEEDSSQDAVYINSQNPKNNNFPVKIPKIDNYIIKDKILNAYIQSLGLKVVTDVYDNKLQYYLYDIKAGVPLTE